MATATSAGVREVYHTNFPIYNFQNLGQRHIIIAGGGGQSKTGVPNAFEVVELQLGEGGVAETVSVFRHDLGRAAAMNACVVGDLSKKNQVLLAVGADDQCSVYQLRSRLVPVVNEDGKSVVRKRKSALTQSKENEAAPRMLSYQVTPVRTVQTDTSAEGEGFQKCCRGSAEALFTAGSDGHIRKWKLPEVEKAGEVKAHTSEVDDIDVSPDGKTVVSVSRDKTGFTWSAADLSKQKELKWDHKDAAGYRFRACRFGNNERRKDKYLLYTIQVPASAARQKSSCYLTRWAGAEGFPLKTVTAGRGETLCAMAVSDNGRFVATATMSGSVSVFVSFSLQQMYHVRECHEVFVTSLVFAAQDCPVNAGQEFTLLSASVDNTVKIHQLDERGSFNVIWLVPFLLLVMLGVFYIFTALGL